MRDAERAQLMLELMHRSKQAGAIRRQLEALGPYDYRRPEREAALAMLNIAISELCGQLRRIDQ